MLQSILNSQQGSIEKLKVQLAESKAKSQKLEYEQEKKAALRHSKQMEEIRNRNVSVNT